MSNKSGLKPHSAGEMRNSLCCTAGDLWIGRGALLLVPEDQPQGDSFPWGRGFLLLFRKGPWHAVRLGRTSAIEGDLEFEVQKTGI